MDKRRVEAVHFIDDSDDEIFLTKILFSREKIAPRLVHYNSLEEFRAALGAAAPDQPMLVCVDLNMPRMKGTDIIASVLADAARRPMIIGICSGSEDPADKLNAKRVGARFFVQKPLNRAALRAICSVADELSFEITHDDVFTLSCSS